MGAESADGDHQTPRSVLENDDEDLHSDASMNSEVHVDPEADNSEERLVKSTRAWVHHMKI